MAAILSLDPIITTTHGKVRGRQRKTVYDDDYYCFDGIPYAKPPLGELRFKSPQAAEPWQGVLDCTEVKPKCLQFYALQMEGSEDCLYLNIYVKSFQTTKPLPVMFYIHGGRFSTGDASRNALGPDYFMMKEVVFITVGHRVGPLGFLSLKDPALKVPGNAGLKDLVAALRWTRNNCAYFNGDPHNITVFGHSSGSISTQLLMLSPQCIGLFHKAVLMAGNVLHCCELPNMGYRLANSIGFAGDKDDEQAVLEFLTNVEATKLVNFDILTPEEKDMGISIAFKPCVEPYATADAILLKQPIELLQNTWSNKIPIMIGYTSHESFIMYEQFTSDEKLYESHRQKPQLMLPVILQLSCKLEQQQKLAEKIKQLHYGDKKVAIENATCAIDLNSYKFFYHACNRFLLARRAKRGNARTYLYRFAFDSPDFNLYRIRFLGPNMRGVIHADELSYLFYLPRSFKLSLNTDEFKTILRMVDIWTSFAVNSNPNCSRLIPPLAWEPLERSNRDKPNMCLNISNELRFVVWPESEKCNVWNSFYEEAGVQLF